MTSFSHSLNVHFAIAGYTKTCNNLIWVSWIKIQFSIWWYRGKEIKPSPSPNIFLWHILQCTRTMCGPPEGMLKLEKLFKNEMQPFGGINEDIAIFFISSTTMYSLIANNSLVIPYSSIWTNLLSSLFLSHPLNGCRCRRVNDTGRVVAIQPF